jgi:hypothetical protein
MKNQQLKDQLFPNRSNTEHPIFTWQKTALIGDEFYNWWLYYGNADGRDTLCHRVFWYRNKPLDQHARDYLAWSLRNEKARLRQGWRKRYQSTNA